MNIPRHIFHFLILFSALGHAGEPAKLQPDSKVRSELTALVEDWIDAEVNDDRATLERILHDDFLSTFASGVTMGKAAYIDFIVALDIAPFSVVNEDIRLHGDTAVVIDVSEDGGTKFTWIAIKRADQWTVIAQTFSRIE
ncbi:MAG: nuclear transport factor 2 family protein [Woeseiaceae bacterium]|nr:nuclear transport factor 2 family protein [Woeseiaceae bacterium]